MSHWAVDLNVSLSNRPRSAGGDGRPGFTVEQSALTQCDTYQLSIVQCVTLRAHFDHKHTVSMWLWGTCLGSTRHAFQSSEQ